MAPLTIPPLKVPTPKPFITPLKLPLSLDPSLVLCLLPFHDDKWHDYSGKGNHGTIHGATPTARGKLGFSWAFDGLDNYVDFGLPTTLQLQNFTLEIWAYEQGDGLNKGIAGYRGGGNSYGLLFYSTSIAHSYHLMFGDGTDYEIWTLCLPLTVNKWNHIIMTRDNKVASIYKNGEYVHQNTFTHNIDYTNCTYFIMGSGLITNYRFQGLMPEARIYNRVLSGLECKALYEQGLA